jgi:hypothetical protein
MNTTIPNKIETIQEAESFLLALIKNDEVYHPEDDAHDIIWSIPEPPTEEECDRLNRAMEQIYELPGFDPCEFIIHNDDRFQ